MRARISRRDVEIVFAYCLLLTACGAPAGIRTPNQQIMRRFEGHQQGETKRDEAVFTESAAQFLKPGIWVVRANPAPMIPIRTG